jgi:glycosyltransferase involved in cell wall biosynthesis
MASRIAIVIAACGQPALLHRTLTSLAACERPAELTGVIVVENGKRSGLEGVVRSFPSELGFRHLFSEPGNQSLAQNIALEKLDGGLAVFTDDDVQWHPQALLAYRDGSRGVDRGEFYGGPVEPEFEGSPPPEWMRPYFPKTVQGYRHAFTKKTQIDAPEFIGPNFAAFVDDLRAIGGIDTRLGPGCAAGCPGAESDAQERLLARGVRGYYLPDALVRHFVRRHCTEPAWVFDRAYRTGVAWGIRRASQPGFGPLRYAKTAYDLLHERLRGARRHLRGDEQGRFVAQYLAARTRGRWHGLALGRQRSAWIGGRQARQAG